MYTFDDIYETMTGQRVEGYEVPGIADAFGPGGCCEGLAEEAFRISQILSRRLGKQEDKDLMALIAAQEAIQKQLCHQLYRVLTQGSFLQYGTLYRRGS